MLQAIADHPVRLNNALQARTGLVLIEIMRSYFTGTPDQLDAAWAELSQILDESATLGNYPVEQLSKLVHEIGEYIDSPAFDLLYEKIVDAVRQRQSEGKAGEAYTERGGQKLQQGKPYDAIQWFGRAEELLIKEEYRGELIMALAGSSYAYERVGLLWAARNKILAAVERSLAVFLEEGEMIPPALLAFQRLAWIELQLGRIPHVLEAMTLASFAASHLKLSDERQARYGEEVAMQEAVLGIHLLNIPFEALPTVSRLPDTLERLGLRNARLALLFALGQEKTLRDEEYLQAHESMADVQTFFEEWQDQPAAQDIPSHPVLVNGPMSLLRSTILGSELVMETPNDPTSFGLAESLLARGLSRHQH
jgi:tetratricopeptide (TPR) repeat protein